MSGLICIVALGFNSIATIEKCPDTPDTPSRTVDFTRHALSIARCILHRGLRPMLHVAIGIDAAVSAETRRSWKFDNERIFNLS